MSMGGHIALRAQIDHAPDLLGVALIAPMIAIETGAFPEGVARGLTRGFTLAGLGNTYALGEGPWTGAGLFDDADALARGANCARDPARAHLREALFAVQPDLRVGGPSARWVSATFRSGDVLAARADEIAVPVWMALAGADGVVRSPASEQLCAAMGRCSAVAFPEARHCMIEDTPALRAAIIDRALAFFEAERTRP